MTRFGRILLAGIVCVQLSVLASVGTAYADQNNPLTDDQYAAFGLSLPDASSLVTEDDPLAAFQPVVISELYLGTMNDSHHGHYEGSFRVMNETTGLSADALNIDSMAQNLVAPETPLDAHDKGFQTQNACAADTDGDGTDEIAELALYTKDKQDFADLCVYDLVDGVWQKAHLTTYTLTNAGSSYIQGIDANTSKSYLGLAAGDHDGDGADEIACYVASRTEEGAYVSVFDPASGSEQRMSLASMSARFDVNSPEWELSGTRMPVASLATTSIS